MSFGEILTNLRKGKGLSQEDLANELNVSRQAVSKWESNSAYPETEKILAICKLFDVSMDELMGLKVKSIKNDKKVFTVLNNWCDNFVKSIRLFFNLSFMNKIFCLLEMGLYLLIIIIILSIFNLILETILSQIFVMIPYEIEGILSSIFRGVLLAFYFIITLVILIKLFKLRYLNYYEIDDKPKVEDIKSEEQITTEKPKKIIIRDSKGFNPLSYLYKFFVLFLKGLGILFLLFMAFIFVLLCTMLMFDLYFINYGLILIFIAIALVSLIVACYVILELIIKLIFNLKINGKKLYYMFIVSLIVLGISIGLTVCELTTYKVEEKVFANKTSSLTVDMKDNLIIDQIEYDNVDIIYEDRDDILVEYYTDDYLDGKIKVNNFETSGYILEYFHLFNLKPDNISLGSLIDDFLEQIKNKTILINMDTYYKIYLHISEENYLKLNDNYNKYMMEE